MPTVSSARVLSAMATAFRVSLTAYTRSCSASRASKAAGCASAGFLVISRDCAVGSSFWVRKMRAYSAMKVAARAGTSASSHWRNFAARSWSVAVPSESAVTAPSRPTPLKAPSAEAAARMLSGVSPSASPSCRRPAASRFPSPPCAATMACSLWRPASSSAMRSAKPASSTNPARCSRAPFKSASPRPAARSNTRSRAHSRSSMARRSSMTVKCGGNPDSSGNRPSSDSQNEWMVRMRKPSGASMVSAKRRRARAASSSPAGRPNRAARSFASCSGVSAAHWPRRSFSRLAISAAAALVKVRQRMRCAGVPASNRREMRSTSTRVLPVPALADTQTEPLGSAAVTWAPMPWARICSRLSVFWALMCAAFRAIP